ncbi:chaperonin 10-like protein [Thermothelomyces heterothallicus CBS 202.75]|uniref:chaperonin 10-like protein n=1 Tax=Thermothelomyces heterothallicus CBS 202.75 TaxID=1149848 RepID=UPI0037428CD0
MSVPDTYRAFRRTTGDAPQTIAPSTEQLPKQLGPKDVLVKIHAVSLNFRDVAIPNGRYPLPVLERGIPCSDAAGEVAAAGAAVTDFAVGDRVSAVFDLNHLTGGEDEPPRELGGVLDGVLREYAVFEEAHLVPLPKYLSWEEAATIPCAGVTAWSALDSLKGPGGKKPRTALLQGTGGVSMFALVLCLAAGVRPIVTSSSDKKLDSVRRLGAAAQIDVGTINYRTVPAPEDRAAEVRRLTGGAGVDVVVNTTGPASVPHDLDVLRERGGLVSFLGFLDGIGGDWPPATLMALITKFAKLKGIRVGSKQDFTHLNRFLEEKQVSLAPLIDRVFPFDESPAAFDYLYSGSHVGKVIIKVRD